MIARRTMSRTHDFGTPHGRAVVAMFRVSMNVSRTSRRNTLRRLCRLLRELPHGRTEVDFENRDVISDHAADDDRGGTATQPAICPDRRDVRAGGSVDSA